MIVREEFKRCTPSRYLASASVMALAMMTSSWLLRPTTLTRSANLQSISATYRLISASTSSVFLTSRVAPQPAHTLKRTAYHHSAKRYQRTVKPSGFTLPSPANKITKKETASSTSEMRTPAASRPATPPHTQNPRKVLVLGAGNFGSCLAGASVYDVLCALFS